MSLSSVLTFNNFEISKKIGNDEIDEDEYFKNMKIEERKMKMKREKDEEMRKKKSNHKSTMLSQIVYFAIFSLLFIM